MAATNSLAAFTRPLGQYLATDDIRRIEDAYAYSAQAHAGQTRASGEPYVTHPLAVASILSDWKFDADGLIAALLHDVIEDTDVDKSEIAARFGGTVADLVDGVSKLDQVRQASAEDRQADSLRKMFAAMDSDVRVMLIKLADRLHNMRTLDVLRLEKRKRIAQETLDIYAAIAARLGLNSLAKELQDLSFKHLHPRRHQIIGKALRTARTKRHDWMTALVTALAGALEKQLVTAQISHREKSIYGIYRKMQEKGNQFSAVSDAFGVRVLVNDARDCYVVLGVLHSLYKPRLDQFKDYIALPKNNGYQSLHTTVLGPLGATVEVQIRTHDMHRRAEVGVAAHWLYKQIESNAVATDRGAAHNRAQVDASRVLSSLLEIQKIAGDSREFLDSVKDDLFPDEIYVFTPKGALLALPRGATLLDFGYAVHTEIGHHSVSGIVNGEQQPLYFALHNGDRVEVVTDSNAHPTPAWIGFANTARAKSRIRHFLRSMLEHDSAAIGERLLKQAVVTLAGDWATIQPTRWSQTALQLGARNQTELFAMVGSGRRLAFTVAAALLSLTWQDTDAKSGNAPNELAITLTRGETPSIRYARCCQPIPGDPVIGIFRKSAGLEIHLASCAEPRSRTLLLDAVEWVNVGWGAQIDGEFLCTLKVTVIDRKGVLAQVAAQIAEADADIEHVDIAHLAGGAAAIAFTLRIRDSKHLAAVSRELRQLDAVQKISRAKSTGKTPYAN